MRVSVLLLVCAVALADPPASGGMELYTWPEAAPRYLFPVAPEDYREITSPTGWRVSPFLRALAYHIGLDITGVYRAQIVAAAAGWVEELWPPPGTPMYDATGKVVDYFRGHPIYGGMILLRHLDGSQTRYAHLSETYVFRGAVNGWRGEAVKAGQVIGRMGATGKAMGPHLHFEILIDGVPVNPLLYVAMPIGARRTRAP